MNIKHRGHPINNIESLFKLSSWLSAVPSHDKHELLLPVVDIVLEEEEEDDDEDGDGDASGIGVGGCCYFLKLYFFYF